MGVDVRERLRAKLKTRIAAKAGAPAKACDNPAPCKHLGAPTGDTVPCLTCRGTVRLKVLACAVHGACTPTKAVAGVRCCATCPDRAPI